MDKSKAFVFFGIVAAGLGISIFTLNKLGEKVEVPEEPVGKVATAQTQETPAKTPGTQSAKPTGQPGEKAKKPNQPGTGKAKSPASSASSSDPAGEKAAAKNKPASKSIASPLDDPKVKASPQAIMSTLSKGLESKDYDGFVKAVGEDAVPKEIRPRLRATIENPDLVLDPGKPYSEISKSADGLRWAINLIPKTGNGEGEQIYTDIEEIAPANFDVTKVGFPLDLNKVSATGKTGATPGVPPTGDPGKNGAKANAPGDKPAGSSPAESNPDALTIAHAFSKAVVEKNFEVARALSDPKSVTDERVAALMIAVEEGKFGLKEDRPLVVTLDRKDITWVLTRVQSPQQTSEFALELGNAGEQWLVNGLTFSKVIAALANQAGAGDVAYTPIIENPEGGDSLVLYFEFDQDGVTQRTVRQLAIVADILKLDAKRKIHISGHADAKGTDDYNSGLSDRRAASIRSTLISKGVSPGQIVTQAFGESKPLSPNFNPDGTDNPTGRSKNRRAEVYLDF